MVGKRQRRGKRTRTQESEDVEYEVKEVLDEKEGGFLLVSWVGYDSSDNTWEPETSLPLNKVKAFRKKQAAENEYEVDEIVDEDEDGRLLVSWVGYDSTENTWESESNLPAQKVRAFRRGQAAAAQKSKSNIDANVCPPRKRSKLGPDTSTRGAKIVDVNNDNVRFSISSAGVRAKVEIAEVELQREHEATRPLKSVEVRRQKTLPRQKQPTQEFTSTPTRPKDAANAGHVTKQLQERLDKVFGVSKSSVEIGRNGRPLSATMEATRTPDWEVGRTGDRGDNYAHPTTSKSNETTVSTDIVSISAVSRLENEVGEASHKQHIAPSKEIRTRSCTLCRGTEDVARQCCVCSDWIHHFCSIDFCESIGVKEDEYGDACFCSNVCYNSIGRSSVIPTLSTPSSEVNKPMLPTLSSASGEQATKRRTGQLSKKSAPLTINLPTKATSKTRLKKVVGSSEKRCGICFDTEDVGRRCVNCEEWIHHFCSIELCEKLGLTEQDYGDNCYCSLECFKAQSYNHGDLVRSDSSDEERVVTAKKQKQSKELADATIETAKSKKLKKGKECSATKKAKTTNQGKTTLAGRKKAQKAPRPQGVYVGANVAFAPSQEPWLASVAEYRRVGSMYLVGVVSRSTTVKLPQGVDQDPDAKRGWCIRYEIRWTTTDYQSKNNIHLIDKKKVEEGIASFEKVNGTVFSSETWKSLCSAYEETTHCDELSVWDEFEEVEDSYSRYEHKRSVPTDHTDVERLQAMLFDPNGSMSAPPDLYTHPDGGTETRLKAGCMNMFRQSASSSFFAFIPLAFWRKVVESSNAYAEHEHRTAITLEEMMTFFGILFYMAMVDKGEYKNYWGDQVEDLAFGQQAVGMDKYMSLQRFIFIRRNLCFRHGVTPNDLKRDAAARIRPLMNIVKVRGAKYVDIGRNVAVDESSVPCRSRYARGLICFNASKPTGKYHFKIYMCCCSTSWLAISFRLHCTSDLDERLKDVLQENDIEAFQTSVSASSDVRKIVVECTIPIHNTKRVVNTDNFYTSCKLLESLKVVGLYGRGTIRADSKLAPRCFQLSKRDHHKRGTWRQGVNLQDKLIAASWMDGSVVNILSNADDSSIGSVSRLINNSKFAFEAPKCIAEYNQGMQGVDRLDQLRGRFSIADGHSFRKWHKKLAMAFIDIARCNAYICRKMSGVYDDARDPHRLFMSELVSDLLNKNWSHPGNETAMMFNDANDADPLFMYTPTRSTPTPSPAVTCTAVSSRQYFPKSRPKRECVVCRFEGRNATERTVFCQNHNVSLCHQTYPNRNKELFPEPVDLTCWQKYHNVYYPKGLYNSNGRIRRSSPIYKATKSLDFDEYESHESFDFGNFPEPRVRTQPEPETEQGGGAQHLPLIISQSSPDVQPQPLGEFQEMLVSL